MAILKIERLQSKNFLIGLINIVTGLWAFSDISYSFEPGAVFAVGMPIEAKVLLIVNILNPTLKTIEKYKGGTLNWRGYLRSRNFRTNVVSALVVLLGLFWEQTSAAVIGATLLNVWNVISHINDDGIKQ